MNNITGVLASFSTLKSLNDSNNYQNSYQILSEFIGYIINTQNLYTFTAVEMKNQLSAVFGFDIPEAVVKTASKNLPAERNNGVFVVDKERFVYKSTLTDSKREAETANLDIIYKLGKFIQEKRPDDTINQEQITKALIAFLIDDQNKHELYFDEISEFILKNESDHSMQNSLDAIREGSIIYIGINYNINETGSIKKNLTLFLDTEVLFSLYGYNGEIFQKIAFDFIKQVQNANSKGKKIHLRYFHDVKREIDSFFNKAKDIVKGKSRLIDRAAMNAIVKNCKSESDVKIKQSDFFHVLQTTYGIIEDEKTDYYSDDLNQFNLESIEVSDEQEAESWKFVSHINKLRKGQIFNDNTESEFLLITNTNNTIKASQEQSKKIKEEKQLECLCDYAVSMERITNILWYKLGYGFGKKDYPNNVSAILKARIVLAASITHSIGQIYNETLEEYKKGAITKDQVAARIITLRKKPLLPEDLEGETIDESMDFSPGYISRYEEQAKMNKAQVEEKDQIIKEITEDNEKKLKRRDEEIAKKDFELQKKDEENRVLSEQLVSLQKEKRAQEKRKEKNKRIRSFCVGLLWKLALVAVLTIIAVFVTKKYGAEIPSYVYGAVDLIALIIAAGTTIKKDYKKRFPSKKNEDK